MQDRVKSISAVQDGSVRCVSLVMVEVRVDVVDPWMDRTSLVGLITCMRQGEG
jgi:hypothetical protein